MGLFCIGIPKVEVHFKLVEKIFNIQGNSQGCLSRCCSSGGLDVDSESRGAVCTPSAFRGVYVRLELLWSGHPAAWFPLNLSHLSNLTQLQDMSQRTESGNNQESL